MRRSPAPRARSGRRCALRGRRPRSRTAASRGRAGLQQADRDACEQNRQGLAAPGFGKGPPPLRLLAGAGGLNPRRRRLPRHRQRLMHRYVRTSLPTPCGHAAELPRRPPPGRPSPRSAGAPRAGSRATRLGELGVVASVGGVCFLGYWPLRRRTRSPNALAVFRSPLPRPAHSSTRSSSLRWGGTPRFAGWSASATPPYSRPRALRTSASKAPAGRAVVVARRLHRHLSSRHGRPVASPRARRSGSRARRSRCSSSQLVRGGVG